MTPKERFLTAMQNGKPDRVPCSPDISNYIPCRKTGRPFWEIYFEQRVPLWQAYIEAADAFGIEMWIASSTEIPLIYDERKVEIKRHTEVNANRGVAVQTVIYNSPAGNLSEELVCFTNEPPTPKSRIIKDIEKDWPLFSKLITPPIALDIQLCDRIKAACHQKNQAYGLTMGYPGFHMWERSITGGIQQLTYLYYDNPKILDQWFELDLEAGTKALELYLSHTPDYLLFGGSGTLTLSSPELVKRYALPALTLWSKMAKEAGVATMLHSCGKSRALVDMLVDTTDIDCINPLEMPPMGDVNLSEVKRSRGRDIALMGNLHTTDTMLYGSPEDVYQASIHAIEAAGANGGFILSTGDQCPLDTPDENIKAMVRAAEDAGRYE